MGKKQAVGGGKHRARTATLDRAARVAHGRAVLQKVRGRVEELEMKGSPGLLGGGKRVTDKTRKKYQDEEVTDYAFHNNLREDEVRVCIQLAQLADEIESVGKADLTEAFETGRLMLTKADLPDLLKLDGEDELEARLRSRLEDQV